MSRLVMARSQLIQDEDLDRCITLIMDQPKVQQHCRQFALFQLKLTAQEFEQLPEDDLRYAEYYRIYNECLFELLSALPIRYQENSPKP